MFSVLYVADQPAALHLGMCCRGVWHSWFPTYDVAFAKYSPGLLLLLELAGEPQHWGCTASTWGRARTCTKRICGLELFDLPRPRLTFGQCPGFFARDGVARADLVRATPRTLRVGWCCVMSPVPGFHRLNNSAALPTASIGYTMRSTAVEVSTGVSSACPNSVTTQPVPTTSCFPAHTQPEYTVTVLWGREGLQQLANDRGRIQRTLDGERLACFLDWYAAYFDTLVDAPSRYFFASSRGWMSSKPSSLEDFHPVNFLESRSFS